MNRVRIPRTVRDSDDAGKILQKKNNTYVTLNISIERRLSLTAISFSAFFTWSSLLQSDLGV